MDDSIPYRSASTLVRPVAVPNRPWSVLFAEIGATANDDFRPRVPAEDLSPQGWDWRVW